MSDSTIDRQPARLDLRRDAEPRHLWTLGLVLEEDGSISGPAVWQDSFLAECGCPLDCLRDHDRD